MSTSSSGGAGCIATLIAIFIIAAVIGFGLRVGLGL